MKRYAAAPERNREPILRVLEQVLPQRGHLVEVASGTGQHAVFFARHLPGLTWHPTDADPASVESIRAWMAESPLPNLVDPVLFDVELGPWPIARAQAVVCINMIHIAPWSACEALLRGAAQVLEPGGPLVLYGPFFREGVETAPSNLAFDADLKSRNPAWGVRALDRVDEAARAVGLHFDAMFEMPSNNLSVVFRS